MTTLEDAFWDALDAYRSVPDNVDDKEAVAAFLASLSENGFVVVPIPNAVGGSEFISLEYAMSDENIQMARKIAGVMCGALAMAQESDDGSR